jgi:protein disulfide-isomerase
MCNCKYHGALLFLIATGIFLMVYLSGNSARVDAPTIETVPATDAQALVSSGEYQGEWLEDYGAAKALAKKLGRPVMLDFSGSDWCGWCIKLHDEATGTDAFKKYAGEKLVLLMVDFPRTKEQPEETKKQNAALAKDFGIQGFPTIVLVDADGKKLGVTGYVPGGAQAFIAELEKFMK